MAGYRTIKQGEHVAGIAKEHGFSDWKTIWFDPANSELKKLRGDPNILFPGDTLFVPDRESGEEPCNTDQKHIFASSGAPLRLRLVMEEVFGKPIGEAPGELTIESQVSPTATDGEGKIEKAVDASARTGLLILHDENAPKKGDCIPFRIGEMDPVETEPGQRKRLANLGYLANRANAESELEFRSAVEEFQCDHPPLMVDGICGPGTQAALKKAHRC